VFLSVISRRVLFKNNYFPAIQLNIFNVVVPRRALNSLVKTPLRRDLNALSFFLSLSLSLVIFETIPFLYREEQTSVFNYYSSATKISYNRALAGNNFAGAYLNS
jgi:hypothetical protein